LALAILALLSQGLLHSLNYFETVNQVLGSGHNHVFVDAHGSPPELFQADIPVVVVGHFTTKTSLDFDGTQILVKHTASYIAKYPKRVKAPNGTTR
jgi:cytochrome c-type biogenesis protein CcmE